MIKQESVVVLEAPVSTWCQLGIWQCQHMQCGFREFFSLFVVQSVDANPLALANCVMTRFGNWLKCEQNVYLWFGEILKLDKLIQDTLDWSMTGRLCSPCLDHFCKFCVCEPRVILSLLYWFGKLGSVVVTQFPITAIREIKILKKLQHENVIKLKEIVTSKGLFLLMKILSCKKG